CPAIDVALNPGILVDVTVTKDHRLIPATVWILGAIANWAGPILPRVNVLCHYQLLIPEAGSSTLSR
ncbi:MAG: hypothetical protein ACFBSF_03325, partial [Leptolyngbyaceae cyanobacterium]